MDKEDCTNQELRGPSNRGQIIISDPSNGQEDGRKYQMTYNKILALLICDAGQVYE